MQNGGLGFRKLELGKLGFDENGISEMEIDKLGIAWRNRNLQINWELGIGKM